MRLWTLSPSLLDKEGLSGAWREALLAKKCLENPGIGYSNHSQLIRFKKSANPLDNINWLLFYIWEEANNRHYSFNYSEISNISSKEKIKVTRNQVAYEYCYLLYKLSQRSEDKWKQAINYIYDIPLSPVFQMVEGKIEDWERPKEPALEILKGLYLPSLVMKVDALKALTQGNDPKVAPIY